MNHHFFLCCLKLPPKYFTKLKSHPDNPAYSCVSEPQNEILFDATPTKIPPPDLRVLPHLEESGINLALIDDVSVLSTAPWTLPPVRLDLATFEKRYN